MIEFEYAWNMPSDETFKIKPIKKWIKRNWKDGITIDPFARNNKLCKLNNDLDPTTKADYHEDGLKFLQQIDSNHADLIMYDPVYSVRQLSEMYKKLGLSVNQQTTQPRYWKNLKHEIARILKPGGIVMTFGWQSGRIHKGFLIKKILLVAHGGIHNDTICTLQTKNSENILSHC